MKTPLRTVKATFIIGFLLAGILFTSLLSSPYSTTASAKIISYPAIISIAIDNASLAVLNNPISIESSVLVHLKIGYSFAGPANILKIPFIGQLWVYGSLIVFPQIIHLTITDKPDWADIYITTPDVYIPNITIAPSYAIADVVISPYQEAPAKPYSIGINAYAPAIGKIAAVNYSITLNFQPDFIPLISTEVGDPVRQVGPRQAVNFPVTIRNLGNKQAIVKGVIQDPPAEWAPLISPTETIIGPGQEATIIFSVVTPYNFGWHNEQRTFTIIFTPEKSPPSGEPVTGTPHTVQVRVNSVGFSTPGFEPILLFAALTFVVIFLKKRKKT
jgi:hypothetical protein